VSATYVEDISIRWGYHGNTEEETALTHTWETNKEIKWTSEHRSTDKSETAREYNMRKLRMSPGSRNVETKGLCVYTAFFVA
jgi:hypothetical protein